MSYIARSTQRASCLPCSTQTPAQMEPSCACFLAPFHGLEKSNLGLVAHDDDWTGPQARNCDFRPHLQLACSLHVDGPCPFFFGRLLKTTTFPRNRLTIDVLIPGSIRYPVHDPLFLVLLHPLHSFHLLYITSPCHSHVNPWRIDICNVQSGNMHASQSIGNQVIRRHSYTIYYSARPRILHLNRINQSRSKYYTSTASPNP